ncbi:uncharacterized protein LOC127860888 [Dreissena polymorpha]|uniref:Uncharacterized protein n=1 Tax=Dreissena polymorpha TaxID=45954 RepID=A0A9D3YJQ7_DREPO|nr:uncharacterized protein LOC127860888 [Dreissena polymorpha]KAH3700130.1 hypothetical protein DPMN_075098 [Dreissena polymorpha]
MASITRSFPKIARHLNYKRTFPSVTSARVDIPCFPYEAFDYSGNQVNPWSILRLVESVRAFTFWKNVTPHEENRSLLDLHEVLQTHLVFIIGAELKIVDASFHEFESAKHPLYCLTELKNLGKSSKTLSYNIFHEGSERHLISCDVTDVLIDAQTRRPVSYPEWWLTKFGRNVGEFRRASLLGTLDPGETEVRVSYFRVTLSDTDTYGHCNWSSYLKYCCESLFEHVNKELGYKWVTCDDVSSGLQQADVLYRSEASLGDILLVQSWSDLEKDSRGFASKCLKFRLLKDGNSCFEAKLKFYTNDISSPSSAL